MKNLKSIAIVVFTLIAFSSCKKDDDNNTIPLKVTLSATVTGNLTNTTISYNDAQGNSKTESLTGNWTKTFTVSKSLGYRLSLKASGNHGGGRIEIKAAATGNGINFSDSKVEETNNSFNFDLTIDHTFKN